MPSRLHLAKAASRHQPPGVDDPSATSSPGPLVEDWGLPSGLAAFLKKVSRPPCAVGRDGGLGPWKAPAWGLETLCEPPKHGLTRHPTSGGTEHAPQTQEAQGEGTVRRALPGGVLGLLA